MKTLLMISYILLMIFLGFKWFSNAMAVRGLLMYISEIYGIENVPTDEKLKEVISMAIKNTLLDFFNS